MSISPRYDQYEGGWGTSVATTALGETVGFFHEKKKGVDRVFVDHPLFLAKVWGKTGDKLYGKASGADYTDNAKRFALFAKAVLDAPTMLPLEYGEDVVFVCNDWHSSRISDASSSNLWAKALIWVEVESSSDSLTNSEQITDSRTARLIG